jgi:hypothetical protein
MWKTYPPITNIHLRTAVSDFLVVLEWRKCKHVQKVSAGLGQGGTWLSARGQHIWSSDRSTKPREDPESWCTMLKNLGKSIQN